MLSMIPSLSKQSLLTLFMLLTLLYPSQSAFKQPTQTCLCDTTDGCDTQCCCDTQCPQDVLAKLLVYNKCNDDNFGIPHCANLTLIDMNLDDLYSGLKTIYMVMRRLFCVYRINIIDPILFYNRSSSASAQQQSIVRINALKSSLSLSPASISSLAKKTITGLFYRSQLGTCIRTNSIAGNINTNGIQECRAYLQDPTQISSSQYLSVTSPLLANSNIKIYPMQSPTTTTPTALTSPSTSCTLSSGVYTCTNVVKYIKLYLNPTTSAIDTSLSYAIVGTSNNIINKQYIIIKYEYIYLNNDGTYGNISNIGYKIGSILQLLKYDTTTLQYYKINNPINLSYRKPDGTCRTSSTDPSDQSLIQFKLGRNQFHTCIGTNSYIYAHLKNTFNFIGIMGSSNNIIKDYIQVNWNNTSPSTPDNYNVLFKIYYVKIGSKNNPQYYINKVNIILTNNPYNDKTLFIQYQEIYNLPTMYIPPPPKVQAYLPNDFLYPFYVAQ